MEYLTYLYMEHEKRPICTAWYIDIRVRGNHLNAITAGRGGQSFLHNRLKHGKYAFSTVFYHLALQLGPNYP